MNKRCYYLGKILCNDLGMHKKWCGKIGNLRGNLMVEILGDKKLKDDANDCQ